MTLLSSNDPGMLQWGAVCGASLVAAIWDLKSRRIPNILTLPLLGFGLVISVISWGWPGLGSSLASCLILAFPFVFLFLFAGGGAGDAKLMGAIGACLGLTTGIKVLAAVCIAGVILALIIAIFRRNLGKTCGNIQAIINGFFLKFRVNRGSGPVAMPMEDAKKVAFPYGVAILIGVAIIAIGAFRG